MDINVIKKDFKESIKIVEKDPTTTCYWKLAKTDTVTWCIALGYNCNYNDESYAEAKLAYISNNSLMSDYDMDFVMPYDETTGEVDDTSCLVSKTTADEVFDWLFEQYSRYLPYIKEQQEIDLSEFIRKYSVA